MYSDSFMSCFLGEETGAHKKARASVGFSQNDTGASKGVSRFLKATSRIATKRERERDLWSNDIAAGWEIPKCIYFAWAWK